MTAETLQTLAEIRSLAIEMAMESFRQGFLLGLFVFLPTGFIFGWLFRSSEDFRQRRRNAASPKNAEVP